MATTSPASTPDNLMTDAVLGALAGVAAVWALDRIDWLMFNREDPQVRHRTQQARPCGAAPAQVAANKAAHAMGKQLEDPQDSAAGTAAHYSIGVAPAVMYGMLHDHVPLIGKGRGALFGLGLFLLQDEAMNRMLGLSARASAYPWQAHARGLIAHLVYGFALDASLKAIKGGMHSTAHSPQHAMPVSTDNQEREVAPPAPAVQPRAAGTSTEAFR
ncbi:MAG: DUF1440 domain-containing protein [Proteobacteria bacterium]|nr:DUF1440 domain-containing protein [Pseudomonadota bacterium]